jgi:hypothetical protein
VPGQSSPPDVPVGGGVLTLVVAGEGHPSHVGVARLEVHHARVRGGVAEEAHFLHVVAAAAQVAHVAMAVSAGRAHSRRDTQRTLNPRPPRPAHGTGVCAAHIS